MLVHGDSCLGEYDDNDVTKEWYNIVVIIQLNRGEPFLSPGAEDSCIPSTDQYYVRYAASTSVHVKAQADLKEHNSRDSVEHTVNTVGPIQYASGVGQIVSVGFEQYQ